jgi:hypothetical protein
LPVLGSLAPILPRMASGCRSRGFDPLSPAQSADRIRTRGSSWRSYPAKCLLLAHTRTVRRQPFGRDFYSDFYRHTYAGSQMSQTLPARFPDCS